MSIKVLLAGETWISQATHYKGFDSFTSVTYHSGADAYIKVLEDAGISVQHMPAHDVPQLFPKTVKEMAAYDVIVLSDIGANSLQLPPETWLNGQSSPDRLGALNEWVNAGGGLIMAGGYLSFQGFQSRANFARSPIAESLPVTMSDYDDRVECSAGAKAISVNAKHQLGGLINESTPALLGYNRVFLKENAELIATVDQDVLIATCTYGAGRTLVWTSDIGPHWCPQEFIDWHGFAPLMSAMIEYVAQGSSPR